MSSKQVQKASLIQSAKTGCALVLVALYLLTGFRIADLHRFTHDSDHVVSHSPSEESNPCHQSLYHASAKACEHEFHLTQDKSCSLCDAIAHHAHVFESVSTEQSFTPSSCDIFIHIPSFVEYTAYTTSDRGPPVT